MPLWRLFPTNIQSFMSKWRGSKNKLFWKMHMNQYQLFADRFRVTLTFRVAVIICLSLSSQFWMTCVFTQWATQWHNHFFIYCFFPQLQELRMTQILREIGLSPFLKCVCVCVHTGWQCSRVKYMRWNRHSCIIQGIQTFMKHPWLSYFSCSTTRSWAFSFFYWNTFKVIEWKEIWFCAKNHVTQRINQCDLATSLSFLYLFSHLNQWESIPWTSPEYNYLRRHQVAIGIHPVLWFVTKYKFPSAPVRTCVKRPSSFHNWAESPHWT